MELTRRMFGLGFVLALSAGLVACDDDGANGTEPPSGISAPSNLQITVTDDDVIVTWDAVAGAESYRLERNIGGGAFSEIASGITDTEYTDSDIAPGFTYGYRVFAVVGSEESAASPIALATVGARLQGTVGAGQVRTLSADTVYLLTGTVVVDSGGELRIPAGTEIRGDVSVQPTALIVRIGGKLFADGTADAPVVFTSSAEPGSRRRGDWGGVVLNGRSICNFLSFASECVGEGNSGNFGQDPPVLDDNSGRLTYVRIEYAGFEVSFGNELNCLTMNGVGSDTEMHHIQTHYGLDDGFEWFGGTVDLKYAIATGISDDSFDYSTGWQGRGQFWIVQQDPQDADNGWEIDGNEDDFNAAPLTDPRIYNVTLVGGGPGSASGESTRGILFRRGTAGKVYNAIIVGFQTAGLDIDNTETANRALTDTLVLGNSIIFDNAVSFDSDDDSIDEQDIFLNVWPGNRVIDPQLADPFNRSAPDFRPGAGSPALTGAAMPPNDGFFTITDFLGGVDPSGAQWFEGWITLDQG